MNQFYFLLLTPKQNKIKQRVKPVFFQRTQELFQQNFFLKKTKQKDFQKLFSPVYSSTKTNPILTQKTKPIMSTATVNQAQSQPSFPPRRCSLPQEPRQRLPSVPMLPRAPHAAKGGSTYDLWRITRRSCQVMQVLNGGKEENMLKRLLVTNMLQKVYRISQDMIKHNKQKRVEKTDPVSQRGAPPSVPNRRVSDPVKQSRNSNKHQQLEKGISCPSLNHKQQSKRQLKPVAPAKRESFSVDVANSTKQGTEMSAEVAEESVRRKGRKLRTVFKGFFSSKKSNHSQPRVVESMA